jgi:hypothetical protein
VKVLPTDYAGALAEMQAERLRLSSSAAAE